MVNDSAAMEPIHRLLFFLSVLADSIVIQTEIKQFNLLRVAAQQSTVFVVKPRSPLKLICDDMYLMVVYLLGVT